MLNHLQRGLALHAKGMVYVLVKSLPWANGQLSLLIDATPAVANGDLMVAPPITTPDNFPLVVLSTGVPIIYSAGDVTGQQFPFDVYDWSLRAWYGEVTEYVNNHAPVMVNDQPQTINLARDLPMAPLDIAALCIDYEADTLTVTTGDSLPPGLVLVGGVLSGIPYTPGSYDINFTASDPAGNTLVYPLFTFVISSTGGAVIDQTITICKIKAGAGGPPGSDGTGADGYSVNLSRESFQVFCYAEGTPVDPTLDGASGQLTVFKGVTDDTAASSLSATGTGCTGTINTSDNYPVAGHPKGYYQVTAITDDSAALNLTVIAGGATIIRTFSVNKARGGYEIVATLPVSNLFTGRMVFLLSDKKLYRYTGTAWTCAVPALDITGTLTDAQIASLAASKITGQLTDAQLAAIAAAKITGQLTDAQLADIAAAKITGQLTSAQIAAIAAAKITGTLTSAQIADLAATKITGQITGTQITDSSISTAKLAAGAVTAGKIAADTITANEIAAGAITATELAAGAVTAGKIAALSIVAGDIAASTITGAKIAADTITGAKIAAGTIVAGNIAAGAITATQLAAGAVSAGKIAAGAIVAGDIAAGAITATQLAAGAVTAGKIAAGTIVAADIAAATITSTQIASRSIVAGDLAANTITANELSSGQLITASAQIGTGVILTANIGNLQVNTAQLANASITNAKIGSLAVQTGNIADLNVTTLKIAGHAVTVPSAVFDDVANSVSLDITTSGGQVSVMCGGKSSSTTSAVNAYIKLWRDGIELIRVTPVSALMNGNGDRVYSAFASMVYSDTPAAGAHTYTLSSPSGDNMSLVILETKK